MILLTDIKPAGPHDPEYIAFCVRCPGCDRWVSVLRKNISYFPVVFKTTLKTTLEADGSFCLNHTRGRCTYHSPVLFRLPPDNYKRGV